MSWNTVFHNNHSVNLHFVHLGWTQHLLTKQRLTIWIIWSIPAIDCMVSEWSEWSECNKSCGKGHTIRTRMIKLEPQFGGSPCPETIQRKKCKIRKCRTKTREERGGGGAGGKRRRHGKQGRDAAVEEQQGWLESPVILSLLKCHRAEMFLSAGCRMQPWSGWTDCTKSCGGGIQERFMNVKKRAKGTPMASCKDRKEIRACNVHPC